VVPLCRTTLLLACNTRAKAPKTQNQNVACGLNVTPSSHMVHVVSDPAVSPSLALSCHQPLNLLPSRPLCLVSRFSSPVACLRTVYRVLVRHGGSTFQCHGEVAGQNAGKADGCAAQDDGAPNASAAHHGWQAGAWRGNRLWTCAPTMLRPRGTGKLDTL